MPYSDNDLNRLVVPTGIIKRFDVLAISSAQVSRVTSSSDLEYFRVSRMRGAVLVVSLSVFCEISNPARRK